MRLPWLKRLALALPVALLMTVLVAKAAAPAFAQQPPPPPSADPSGTKTGTVDNLPGVVVNGGSVSADDVAAAKDKEPFAYNLASYVDQNRIAINMVWLLV